MNARSRRAQARPRTATADHRPGAPTMSPPGGPGGREVTWDPSSAASLPRRAGYLPGRHRRSRSPDRSEHAHRFRHHGHERTRYCRSDRRRSAGPTPVDPGSTSWPTPGVDRAGRVAGGPGGLQCLVVLAREPADAPAAHHRELDRGRSVRSRGIGPAPAAPPRAARGRGPDHAGQGPGRSGRSDRLRPRARPGSLLVAAAPRGAVPRGPGLPRRQSRA